ncbi:MAG: hypothetical protein D3922_05080 [Candidatus Electrothrix sp. AR1]|nr:hypothetical protein [Candidatus Electrothrix sp. AR1]
MLEDYIIREKRRFHGTGPVLRRKYTLAWGMSGWPEWITFNMAAYRSLLVEIKPLKKPCGIILYGSRVGSPRLLKAVWTYDEVRNPVILQTGKYWLNWFGCNAVGCPKLKFQVTRGSLTVTIKKMTSR